MERKRLFKLAVSGLVGCWDSVSARLRAAAGQPAPGTCTVLYYHAVPPEDREAFAVQMEELLRTALPLPSDFRGELCPGTRYVAVTFDDGFRSVLANALPELEKRGIPCTIFVPTAYVGKDAAWCPPGSREQVLTREELQGLAANPLVSVGSHGVMHRDMARLDPSGVEEELTGSRRALEEILARDVRQFSFPHGRFTPGTLAAAREAGYTRVFSILPRRTRFSAHEFVVGRVLTDSTDPPLEFRLKIRGAYRWMAWVTGVKDRFRTP